MGYVKHRGESRHAYEIGQEAKRWVNMRAYVEKTTEKAVYACFSGSGDELWIPRSVIQGGQGVAEGGHHLKVQRWFCAKNNLLKEELKDG